MLFGESSVVLQSMSVPVVNWIMSPNSYVEAPAPSASVFGDGAYKDVIKVEWGQNHGALIWQNLCSYKKKRPSLHVHTEKVIWSAEKVAVCKLGKEVSMEWNFLASWSWTSCLQNHVKIISLCVSCPSVEFYYGDPSRPTQSQAVVPAPVQV